MIQIKAAARLQTAVTAALYEGTKIKDLLAWLNSQVSGLNLKKPAGGGGPGPAARDPSLVSTSVPRNVAASLAQVLVDSGWKGSKLSRKLEDGTKRHYILYVPLEQDGYKFVPTICIYKPDGDKCMIKVRHPTHASHRELRFLNDLNRRFNKR